MTVLVTGSAGHLGEALMRLLRGQGREARGIDIKASAFTDLVGSIADRDMVGQAMEGVDAVLHTATLHKPHVVTHTPQQFIETNVLGTQLLLDAAAARGVRAFIQTSTTSAFGDALTPLQGEPASWITEDVRPQPKNIYGATKLAAEHLCQVVARNFGLPVVVLRTSRFFPEDDDNRVRRAEYSTENLQAIELLGRRADIEDMATAHLAAIERASEIGFGTYIVSATSPFVEGDLPWLTSDAPAVIARHHPEAAELFAAAGWRLPQTIDRVYVNRAAQQALGWEPVRDFRFVLDCVSRGEDFRSELAQTVGAKGYHDEVFEDGPYPVTDVPAGLSRA
ncbi:NAD-dependent epimerase/dehydratase family protein [Altererythrobacter salegens]|uniref:NAD-dependent epimerase/dehydratase family protein n=1 Tax=Croceibacterium salegens TaxID=1737568 RepID=A0A6I4SZC4_9SPHN|nr:NAD(P)-dependent oxidoreductase [Croceibacterium salegens]MXO61203.1 NAD-dependent epimerase/dehydratase family protein [Croceibacterium salegens]